MEYSVMVPVVSAGVLFVLCLLWKHYLLNAYNKSLEGTEISGNDSSDQENLKKTVK